MSVCHILSNGDAIVRSESAFYYVPAGMWETLPLSEALQKRKRR